MGSLVLSDDTERKSLIAEIMGIMEKLDKDKYWLLESMRKNNLRALPGRGTTRYELLLSCPTIFLSHLLDHLNKTSSDENESPKVAHSYHWFFTDIVASSEPSITVDDQARKIISFNKLIEKTNTFRNRDQKRTIILPTGDGYAIGFKDNPEKPLLLAIELHEVVSEYNADKSPRNRIDIRVGLDTGPVYHITDILGNRNVWGPGIVYARRIMDMGRARSILASARFANDVQRLKPEFKRIMHLIGNYPIKHGEKISLYNVYGKIHDIEVGTKKNPLARRVQESASESMIRKITNTFLFDRIEIILEVIDPASMLTHHTWIWHVINQTEVPVDTVYYYLEGDRPRSFPELNLKVTDEENRELQIKNLNVNKEDRKEFFVQLIKPLKPQQKGRFVKLQYDWEESDRKYVYKFGSDCKRFRFLLRVPKGMPISQKVAKVSQETGDIAYAKNPPIVRYLKDVTEVEWIGTKIMAFDAFRFDW